MILQILTLCTALYSSEGSQSPYNVVCESYKTPRAYDVRQCPGEVTTNRAGTIATCEIVLPLTYRASK